MRGIHSLSATASALLRSPLQLMKIFTIPPDATNVMKMILGDSGINHKLEKFLQGVFG